MTRRIGSLLSFATTLALSALAPRAADSQAMTDRAAGRLDHRELAADEQILHALSRLTFGGRPGDAQRVRSAGLDKWVDDQLHPERIENVAIERFLSRFSALQQDEIALLTDFRVDRTERRMAREPGDTTPMRRQMGRRSMEDEEITRGAVVAQLQSARVARAIASNRQLEEVMTDFWLNHFNIFAQKGPPQPYYLVDYEKSAIRPNVFGKFRDLLAAVAKSPAMLFYLDNSRSMADSNSRRLEPVDRRRGRGSPRRPQPERQPQLQRLRQGGLNENYGRELLELHTLGVDGGYTQQDVIGVARALTGWTIRPAAQGGGFIFRPLLHDAGEKLVLGHRLRADRGIEDGEQVLDMLAKHPATARHIARKLATRFVSDSPPPALVDEAATVFLRTDGDIREVVRTIITSNEFYSRGAYRSKVKSPFEVVVSALRAMNAQPDETPRTARTIARLGQPIYGHQAPNGYPETGDAWMNAGAILNRINFGIAAAANRLPGADVRAIPGLESLRTAPREQQADAIAALLLGGSVSAETRAILISGENPLQRPDQETPRLAGIAQIVGLALGSPEFQRR